MYCDWQVWANSVDPNATECGIWSGSALSVTQSRSFQTYQRQVKSTFYAYAALQTTMLS